MTVKKQFFPMEQLAQLITLQLDRGGRAEVVVTGSSMMPMLRNCKDSVTLIPYSGNEKKGDILFFRRDNGRYVLHRIIGLTPDGYLCCGDNQAEIEQVAKSQCLATVAGFTRKGTVYHMQHMGYRLYVALWVGLFPLRRFYIPAQRYLGELRRKMRKKT